MWYRLVRKPGRVQQYVAFNASFRITYLSREMKKVRSCCDLITFVGNGWYALTLFRKCQRMEQPHFSQYGSFGFTNPNTFSKCCSRRHWGSGQELLALHSQAYSSSPQLFFWILTPNIRILHYFILFLLPYPFYSVPEQQVLSFLPSVLYP